MSDLHDLKLLASVPKSGEPFIPPLQQVVIFINNLGYICGLDPQWEPKEPFEISPCSSDNFEDSDGGIRIGGIDALGQYDSKKISVSLNFCRIARLCATQGFNREDVATIVLTHELAHFVTHIGTNSGAYWDCFCKAKSKEKEDFAQEATHLLLRVGGYGHLVQVFGALSQLCPPKYDIWRQTWKTQIKSKNSLETILTAFRDKIHGPRKVPEPSQLGDDPDDPYDN
jgi:hypothetical protein